MSVEYWQPWTPQIGQRVRIRLSGECRRPFFDGSIASRIGMTSPHFEESNGMTGRRVEGYSPVGDAYAEKHGHPFVVLFDEPIVFNGETFDGDHFAASELEPLEGSA